MATQTTTTVANLFVGWHRPAAAATLAAFFAPVAARKIVAQKEWFDHSCARTVHEVFFDGPPVARVEHAHVVETWVEGNILHYST